MMKGVDANLLRAVLQPLENYIMSAQAALSPHQARSIVYGTFKIYMRLKFMKHDLGPNHMRPTEYQEILHVTDAIENE